MCHDAISERFHSPTNSRIGIFLPNSEWNLVRFLTVRVDNCGFVYNCHCYLSHLCDDKKTRTMQCKMNAEEFFSGRNVICLLMTKLCGYDKDNNTLKSSVLEKEDDV